MKLLTCDDHALFRSGLRVAVEELDSAAELLEAGSASELFERLEEDPDLDLLLLDLGLPDATGLDLLERVREGYPATPVVIVSASEDPGVIRSALELGAMGFIPKSSSGPVLISAIGLVLSGGVYLPPSLLEDLSASEPQGVAAAPSIAKRIESLTARQQEVIELMAKGLTNREIASVLGIAMATVKTHAATIYTVLEVTNRTEAAVELRSLLQEED